MNKEELTYETAHELLYADYESGILTWKKRSRKWFKKQNDTNSWNARFANKVAGSKSNIGRDKYYNVIGILGKIYYSHRILFLMKNGYYPLEIDHIDGNGLNNKLSNLREATRQDNCMNKSLNKNNTSGVCGVHWNKVENKWHASIGFNKKTKHIGNFVNKSHAVNARKKAEVEYGFHTNHGKQKSEE